ncbi:hypothetical protein AGMMS49975_15650 [Clostridia bacterium]|nr:hypothetical protein AGMMS49975_15650 [Clostridia bacterium]
MIINRKIVPAGIGTNPNKNMAAIKYITIHNTGNYNAGATAQMHANLQYNGNKDANGKSREASWHYTVDDKEIWQSFEDNQMCWHAGDGNGNSSSIAIEICDNDKSKFVQACENAAWLTASLLTKYGLTAGNIKQHYDWSGKDCPKELRAGTWGINWGTFLQRVWYFMKNIPDTWAKESWQWGIDKGITTGERPKDAATRQEIMKILYDYDKRARISE